MITSLRHDLQMLLQQIPCSRVPTLRRCKSKAALLATNLPYIASESDVRRFISLCQAHGWTVRTENNWLLLDHPVSPPDVPVPIVLAGEVGCLISLLLRHPCDHAPCEEEIRSLCKAYEESPDAVRRACETLHAQWAECLRRHEPLPGGLLPYLCAIHTNDKEEKL